MRISGITYASVKKRRRFGFVKYLLIILIMASVITVAISAYISWNLTHPVKLTLITPKTGVAPEYNEISFKSASNDNITLKGWLFRSFAEDKKGTIILVHGYGKNRLQFGDKTYNFVKSLIKADFDVFAFDLRHSGKSSGNTTTFGIMEKYDVQAAIEYISSFQNPGRIILIGYNTGAAASLLAAAGNSKVSAVIADNPYINLKTYLESSLSSLDFLPQFPFKNTILMSMKFINGIEVTEAALDEQGKNLAHLHLLLFDTSPGSNTDEALQVKSLYDIYKRSNGEGLVTFMRTESYSKDASGYITKILAFLQEKLFSE